MPILVPNTKGKRRIIKTISSDTGDVNISQYQKIVKRVNKAADNYFVWQEGTIYPALRKLEKDGLLRSQWEHIEKGRKRKYYYITSKGREAISEGAKKWQGFYQIVMRTAEAYCV